MRNFLFDKSKWLKAAVVACLSSGLLCSAVYSQTQADTQAACRFDQAGAFYYPWYSSSRWKNSEPTSGYPLMGGYDNGTAQVLHQHILWAKRAGVSHFVFSWLGKDKSRHSIESRNVDALIAQAEVDRMSLFALYETAIALNQHPDRIDFSNSMDSGESVGDRFVSDVLFLLDNLASSPAYLRSGQCPKLAIYLTRNLVNQEAYFDELHKTLKRRNQCLDLLADVVWWGRSNRPIVHDNVRSGSEQWSWLEENFSAVFGYNLYSHDLGKYGASTLPFDQLYLKAKVKEEIIWRQTASRFGLSYVATVQPGYDDRPLRGADRPAIKPSREFLLRNWALVTDDLKLEDSVFVTTFNEWYEGTAIEPGIGSEMSLLDANREAVESAGQHLCKERSSTPD